MSKIHLHRLVKEWGGIRAVDDVSFTVEEGAFTVLLGPSGCGKSTLLRMIAGLESITSGTVFIDGVDVTEVDAADRGISMVFQSYALFPHLNVKENILFGLKVRKVDRRTRNDRLQAAAELVGLTPYLDRKPAQLSGGQRQRVALARTIVSRQPVCLMDEPLSNLDAKLRGEMRDEIKMLQQQFGLTVLFVTHDQTEAMTMADQVILLKDGKVQQIGAPKELYTSPNSIFAARFIGAPPMNILESAEVMDSSDNKAGYIGIRPEDIRLDQDLYGSLTMEISALDYLGSETLIHLQNSSSTIIAKVPGDFSKKKGEQVQVGWKPSALHYFSNT
jgi:sn-glycerol 3-phosphate transport system ATP-binding protein